MGISLYLCLIVKCAVGYIEQRRSYRSASRFLIFVYPEFRPRKDFINGISAVQR